MVWSRTGKWRPEEEGPLVDAFGDDVTIDLIERSPVDPRVMLVWVEWDRLPPSIYLVSFQQLTPTGTPMRREYMSVAEAKSSPEWAQYFPSDDSGTPQTSSRATEEA